MLTSPEKTWKKLVCCLFFFYFHVHIKNSSWYQKKSQNHWFWRCLHRSAGPTPLLKAGSTVYFALGHVQLGSECFQDRESTTSQCYQFQFFYQSHSKIYFIIWFKWNFLYFNLCILPLVILLDAMQISLSSWWSFFVSS